jgi:predicted dithiol-disulfide oxidoreductase (DUF899 family)
MMPTHEIATRETWLDARKALLAEEKALTRANDALAAKRRALPWVKVEKDYVFDGPDGRVTLAELFAGKRQLIVYHFMFGPGWEEGCVGCSFLSDGVNAILPHLDQKDVAYVAVSRASFAELDAFRRRMGWNFRWVSAGDGPFNHDFHVSFTADEMARGQGVYNFETIAPPIDELSGVSVFIKGDDGAIFHTYSQYGRGGEELLIAYGLLDMTPLGRQEEEGRGNLSDWVRHHDRYGAAGEVAATGRFVPAAEPGCPACAAP